MRSGASPRQAFFHATPLAPAAAGLISGMSSARLFSFFPCSTSLLLAFAAVAILAIKNLSRPAKLSAFSFVAAGFIIYFLYGPGAPSQLAGYVGKGPVQVTGEVARPPQEHDGRTTLLLMPCIPGGRVAFHKKSLIRLTVAGTGLDIGYGDVLLANLKLETPGGFRNPGGFNWADYAAIRGEEAESFALPSDITRQGNRSWYLLRRLHEFRRELLELSARGLKGEEGALFKSLILGDQGSVTEGMRDRFAATGTTHILSVSGSHIALLVLFIFLAADGLFLIIPHPLALRSSLWFDHKKAAAAFCLLAAFAYSLLAGMEVATVRSLIMVTAFLIARIIDREARLINMLSAAAIAVLVWDPAALFDISFQLSYGSVLFMALAVEDPPTRLGGAGRPGIRERFFNKTSVAVLTSMAVIAGTTPKIAAEFNSFSLVALPANMVAVPVAGIAAVPVGLMSCLIHAIHPGNTLPLLEVNRAVLRIFLQLVGWFSAIPSANLHPAGPGIILSAAFYAALTATMLWKAGALRKTAAVAGCLAAFLAVDNLPVQHRQEMRVTFIDVGQGDSALVEFPDGKTMLIDGGGNPRGIDPGRAAVAPYLWDRGIRRIDILVLSHPHPDHAGGLAYMLRNFKVGQVWEGGVAASSGEYAAFNGLVKSKEIPRRALTDTGEMHFGGTTVQVLSSKRLRVDDNDKEDYVRENNRSLVLRIKYGGVSVLFPGDIQVDAEDALLQTSPPLPLKSTALKAPHHGGASSLNERFLLAVKPDVAAVSIGRSFYDNGFSASSTGFLKGIGTKVYNTHQSGAVVFHTDGKTWHVETFKDRELEPATGPLQELENYRRFLS